MGKIFFYANLLKRNYKEKHKGHTFFKYNVLDIIDNQVILYFSQH